MESNVMQKILKRIPIPWTSTGILDTQQVLIDGEVVLMSEPQARRYWELKLGTSEGAVRRREPVKIERFIGVTSRDGALLGRSGRQVNESGQQRRR